MDDFVNLHSHVDSSILDGLGKLEDVAKRLNNIGQKTIAITDHGSMGSFIEAHKIFKKYGIKYIPGIELYTTPELLLENDERKIHSYFRDKNDDVKQFLTEHQIQFYSNKEYVRAYMKRSIKEEILSKLNIDESTTKETHGRHHQTVLAYSNEGIVNLNKLSAISNSDGFYHKPIVHLSALSKYKNGLIILSGCLASLTSRMIIHDEEQFHGILDWYVETFGDKFYLEIMNTGVPEQIKVLEKLRIVSKEKNIPIVATSDIHYAEKEDAFVHEILLAINQRKVLSDPAVDDDEAEIKKSRWRFSTNEYYIKSREELGELFTQEELDNTVKVAERCNVDVEKFLGEKRIPKYPNLPEGKSSIEYMKEICREGWKSRNLNSMPNKDEYAERIKYEIDCIESANLADYFLMVWDICKYADNQDIKRGIGRGSAGGSMIAWLMNITQPDPVKYKLYFERFWNPGRSKSLPDIDLDFDIEERDKVIKYVSDLYGEDRVIQIVTFSTMQLKMCIKDVCRVFEFPDKKEVEKICATVPLKYDDLDDAINKSEKFKKYVEKYPDIFKVVRKLENVRRAQSSHPSAFIISNESIYNGCMPLLRDTKRKKLITGVDQYSIEDMGFVKLDILGLKTISVFKDIERTYNDAIRNNKDVETINETNLCAVS